MLQARAWSNGREERAISKREIATRLLTVSDNFSVGADQKLPIIDRNVACSDWVCGWGARGRGFKSRRSDTKTADRTNTAGSFFLERGMAFL